MKNLFIVKIIFKTYDEVGSKRIEETSSLVCWMLFVIICNPILVIKRFTNKILSWLKKNI